MVSGDGSGTAPARRLVAGRYELLFELARGGMGVVHVARSVGAHGVDRLFAIKELLDPDDDPRARESFLEEARVSAKIDHPNVLPTLELFEDDGVPFIVMDLVRGVSLWQLLARLAKGHEPPSVALSAWIVMQAASGLHAAHELCDSDGRPLGLVHRDVSPQNILLGFNGRVCVADFGIAKLRRATVKTESGLVKGKFAYMSPEQARGFPLDRRSDVFSLGVVLHETLTGRRLFDHDSPTETLLHIIAEPIPTPRTVRPDVPDELSTITMKCLAKAPDDRFATADALSRALRSALRTRQADADEQTLRELLDRVHASQRDALTGRLGALVPASPLDSAAGDRAQATTTIIDAMPPAFSDSAVPDPSSSVAVPQTPAPSEIPMRPLSRALSTTVMAVGALVIAAGTYGAVRWSLARAEDTATSGQPPAAAVSASAVTAATTPSHVPQPVAGEPPSATTLAPSAAPATDVTSTSQARTPHSRRPLTGPKPTVSARTPDEVRPVPPQAAAIAPAPATSSSSSKGVPFRAF